MDKQTKIKADLEKYRAMKQGSSTAVSQKTGDIKADLQAYRTAKTVPRETTEVPEKKGGLVGRFIKSLVSAPATIVARPLQLAAEAIMPGDNTEAIDRFSKEKLGGIVAPVPRGGSDVVKDVGRAAETVAWGIGGGGLVKAGGQVLKQTTKQAVKTGAIAGAKAGGLAGAGQPLIEKGADTTLTDVLGSTAKGAAMGGVVGAVLPAIAGKAKTVFGKKIAERAEKRMLLESGATDARIAKLQIQKGKISTDPVAKEVIRQGIPEADVALIKGGSRQDKTKMMKMLDVRESQLTNKRVVDRATDVVGDTFTTKIAAPIEKLNKEAGKRLEVVARGLEGKKIDPTKAVTQFVDEMEKAGITFKSKGQLNFRNSNFEGLKGAQSLINNVWKRAIRVARSGDALEAHRLKSYIDEIVNYGKQTEGLSGKAQNMLKSLRHNVDGILDTKFPAYNEVNTQFADTISQLDQMGVAIGKRFKIGDTFSDAQAGLAMRRILSNTQSRAEILKLLDGMQNVLVKYGQKIDEDIITQANFADVLEKMLGTEAPTSFLGQVGRGAETFGSSSSIGGLEQIGSAGSEFARGNLIRGTIKAGGVAIDVLRGINQEKKIKALRELLKVSVFGR